MNYLNARSTYATLSESNSWSDIQINSGSLASIFSYFGSYFDSKSGHQNTKLITKLLIPKESSEQAKRESSFNSVYCNNILKQKGFENNTLIIACGN